MKRLEFIDVLRGLAIVLMVINHGGHYLTASPLPEWAYLAIYLTVTLAAPLFLFLVGFSLVLSKAKNRDFFYYLKRGIFLILFGFLINICFYPLESWYTGRVLFAIGLSIILAYPFLKISIEKKVSAWLSLLAIIGLASFSLFEPYLQVFSLSHPVIADVLLTEFPIYPWFFLVLLGLAAGREFIIAREEDRAKIYRGWLMTGILLLLAWLVLTIQYQPLSPWSFTNDFILNNCWNPALITWFWVLGFIYLFFNLSQWLASKYNALTQPLQLIGRQALVLYWLQFLLVKTISGEWLEIRLASGMVFISSVLIVLLMMIGFVSVLEWKKGEAK